MINIKYSGFNLTACPDCDDRSDALLQKLQLFQSQGEKKGRGFIGRIMVRVEHLTFSLSLVGEL